MSDVGTGKDSEATEVSVARDETSRRFTRFFRHSLRYALSLGVNLLGHNGNSQDGRMKVLIWLCSRRLSCLTECSGLEFPLPLPIPFASRGEALRAETREDGERWEGKGTKGPWEGVRPYGGH